MRSTDRRPKYDLENPFESETHGWIQWKGTEVCADMHCECGYHGHIDGMFAYCYECPNCGIRYQLNGHIKLHKLTKEEGSYYDDGCLITCELED